MSLIRNAAALIRGNIICLAKKTICSKTFNYNPKIRVFSKVLVSLRNKGRITLNKNIKIDSGAFIASNGGNIILGENVGVGRNNVIVSQEKISVGSGTILSPNVFIYDHDHDFDEKNGVKVNEYRRSAVTIGENCWIGANTVILRGTTVGNNCLVGAGCVLKGNYPDNSKIIQKKTTTIIGENTYENGDSNRCQSVCL